MQPIGTPMSSIPHGIGFSLFFGAMTAGLSYQAYNNSDSLGGFVSTVFAAITGLAVYNTTALLFPEDSVNEQNVDLSIVGAESIV